MTLSPRNIRKIFELRDVGRSVKTTAKKLKIGESTVQRYLKKGGEATLKYLFKGVDVTKCRYGRQRNEISSDIVNCPDGDWCRISEWMC